MRPETSVFAYLLTLLLPFLVAALVLGFFHYGRKLAASLKMEQTA
jgi:hypothetical protein